MAKLFKYMFVVVLILSAAACGRGLNYNAILPFEGCMNGTGEVHALLLPAEGDSAVIDDSTTVTRLADYDLEGRHLLPTIQVTIGDRNGTNIIVAPGVVYPVWEINYDETVDDWVSGEALGFVGWCGGPRFTFTKLIDE